MPESLIRVEDLHKSYKKLEAVKGVSFEIPKGQIFGLIGPDGAGKTSIIQCLAGVLSADRGEVSIAGISCLKKPEQVKPIIGYMPQGLGLNLYDNLSVEENINFFRELRCVPERTFLDNRNRLLEMTRLAPFSKRPAGKLSGGMRQKLALICTLIHLPDILLLDEPTTGVDPISRRDFWQIIQNIVSEREVTVLLSTSYMDEAERCHQIAMMHQGEFIAQGTPTELVKTLRGQLLQLTAPPGNDLLPTLRDWPMCETVVQIGQHYRLLTLDKTDDATDIETSLRTLLNEVVPGQVNIEHPTPSLEDVFIQHTRTEKLARPSDHSSTPTSNHLSDHLFETPWGKQQQIDCAINTKNISCQFGDFTAVDQVDLAVEPGEIFGLLGPNGAGKTTLIKMLCGLQKSSAGSAQVIGYDTDTEKRKLRHRIGYMSQKFSLYRDLSVVENMHLYSGLYGIKKAVREQRIGVLLERLDLAGLGNRNTLSLPLGIRQRVALACALIHQPLLLFLDEPTSGVDPVARRQFWEIVHALAENEGVTIIVSTHYMDEAEHCHRLGFMQQGRMVITGTPDQLKQQAEQMDGSLVTIESEQFAAAFEALKPEFSGAIYYGRRVQWQSKTPQQDQDRAAEILQQSGIKATVGCHPLSIEEAFVSFIQHDLSIQNQLGAA
ncbi:MAG: ATP-binding cassette domain-containing protein [Pseudomonadales bacterium]|nr:ATP-binding cassette domain-containing protein [Pseudomonadales bacterium]